MKTKTSQSIVTLGRACILSILILNSVFSSLLVVQPVQAYSQGTSTASASLFLPNWLIPAAGSPNVADLLEAADVVTGTRTFPPFLPTWLLPTPGAPTTDSQITSAPFSFTITTDPLEVSNGQMVTFIMRLEPQATPVQITFVRNRFDENTLSDIHCVPAPEYTCSHIFKVYEVPEPSGTLLVITATRELEWNVNRMLTSTLAFTFTGTIIGQPQGAQFKPLGYVDYIYNGSRTEIKTLELTIQPQFPDSGGGSITEAPVWFSEDWGGTIDQAWGDFDGDGQLDLALGSSLGASIYRNEQGRLVPFWSNIPDPDSSEKIYHYSYGVAWADFKPDTGYLELVVVGNSTDGSASGQGINYIYEYNPNAEEVADLFIQSAVFTTEYQLVRVVAGDFDKDGDIDIIASTNLINAECPVVLYRNDGTGMFTGIVDDPAQHDVECISKVATAALGANDYNRDGALDLVLGGFPNALKLLRNNSATGPITNANPFGAPLLIDTGLQYIPYDLAWGDFDQDGWHDLAAAYPLQREVIIYKNVSANNPQEPLQALTRTLRTLSFMTPLALDWADFDGDGKLELLVADTDLKIYKYNAGSKAFEPHPTLNAPGTTGQAWSVKGIDINNQHNLDLSITSRDGPSQYFSAFQPNLDTKLTLFSERLQDRFNGASIAWGNFNGDQYMDLVIGSGAGSSLSYYYQQNSNDSFTMRQLFKSVTGPNAVAMGDVDRDGRPDIAIGGQAQIVQIYYNRNVDTPWEYAINQPITALAWGDSDDDGKLDLLVGGQNGAVYLFKNTTTGTTVSFKPVFTTSVGGRVSELIWGDYNNDYYLDFAVAVEGGRTYVYRSNGDRTFSRVWNTPRTGKATAIAWADYNNNGYLDLAIGYKDSPLELWHNQQGAFGTTPDWQSSNHYTNTTSIAWGDWDNDGYPELAVGRNGAVDVVYANLSVADGARELIALWTASQPYSTTDIAWGDLDNDGDLDLAISAADGYHGVYKNSYAGPHHRTTQRAVGTQLPNNTLYLNLQNPNGAAIAYHYASPIVVGSPSVDLGPTSPTVTVQYRVYDYEQDPGKALSFEYSLNGGADWRRATPAANSPPPPTQISRTGTSGSFIWAARTDNAISENALFRICYAQFPEFGGTQSNQRCAVSPPFRVRGQTLECEWPLVDIIVTKQNNPDPNFQTYRFVAYNTRGQGSTSYYWDFGDGSYGQGKEVIHTFPSTGQYKVTVRCELRTDCNPARPAYASVFIPGGFFQYDWQLYLPSVVKNYGTAMTNQSSGPANLSPTPTSVTRSSAPILDTPAPTAEIRKTLQIAPAVRETRAPIAIPSKAPLALGMRITHYALGVNSQPEVNSDGTRIAFWSTGNFGQGQTNLDGNIEIFIADYIAEKNQIRYTQVTSSTGSILAGFNLAPTVSGDGARIAFFSDRDLVAESNLDRNFEIYMAQIGATSLVTEVEIVQVTNTPRGVNILPDISENGQHIAYATDYNPQTNRPNPNGSSIYRATLHYTDTGGNSEWSISQLSLTGWNGHYDQPTINKDGTLIAFVGSKSNETDSRHLFLAKISPDNAVTVTQLTTLTNCINDLPKIGMLPSIAGEPEKIRIAFVSDCDYMGNTLPNEANREIFMVEINTSSEARDIIQITNTPAGVDHNHPNISADGTRISFIEIQDGKTELYLYDLWDEPYDHVTPYPNPTPGTQEYAFPALSADGTHLVFVSNWDVYMATYPLADISVHKTSNTAQAIAAEPNQELTYTLAVSNAGPSPAIGVKLTDTLPIGLILQFPEPDSPLLDYVDDDGDPETGFGVTTADNIAWLTPSLRISNTQNNALALPDQRAHGWVNMRAASLLLHMDSDNLKVNSAIPEISLFCTTSTCPTPETGMINDAARFDADKGLYASHDSIHRTYDLTNTFTLGGWVSPQTTSGGLIIYKEGSSGLNYNLQLQYDGATFYPVLQLQPGPSGNCSLYYPTYSSNQRLPLSQWHHIMVTYEDSIVRFYINGQQRDVFYTGLGDNLCTNTGRLYIGNSSTTYFAGLLDEIVVVKRALSAEEIATIYQTQQLATGGRFDSRIMEETTGAGWRELAWEPFAPYGKPLPDQGLSDNTGYVSHTVSMAENVLLLHFEDTPGSQTFLDSSPAGNDAVCDTCPTLNAIEGIYQNALHFPANNQLRIPESESLREVLTSTWTAWVKFGEGGNGILFSKLPRIEVYASANGAVRIRSAEYAGAPLTTWEVATPKAFNLEQWHHIVITSSGALNTHDVGLYINGQSVTLTVSNPSTQTAGLQRSPLYIHTQGGRSGNISIDEVAVFTRILSPAEIESHYRRGAMSVLFQVRACQSPDCSDAPPFVGPDNTPATFYTDQPPLSSQITLPNFALPQGFNSERYFQYRVFMHSRDANHTPEVRAVKVGPQAECETTRDSQFENPTHITCTLSSEAAPLGVDQQIIVQFPTAITSHIDKGGSVVTLTVGEGTEAVSVTTIIITNTAGVRSDQSDHGIEPNNFDFVTTTITQTKVARVSVGGPRAVPLGAGITYTATVWPATAYRPITYTWQLKNMTGTLSSTSFPAIDAVEHTQMYTFTTDGVYTITVAAGNAGNETPVTGSLKIGADDPVVGLTARNSSPTKLETVTRFTAEVTSGTGITYIWNFGDNSAETPGAHVTHQYSSIGTYTATVTATNSLGTFTETTTVEVDVPIAAFHITSNSPVTALRPVNLVAHPGGGTRVTYTWELGDSSAITHTGTGAGLQHNYTDYFDAEQKIYMVTVTATNSLSQVVATHPVTVNRTCWAHPENPVNAGFYFYVQDAIEKAADGAIVQLAGYCHPKYEENYVAVITKNLTLRGGYIPQAGGLVPDTEPRAQTVLDALGLNATVLITDSTVTLQNLYLTGGQSEHGGGIWATRSTLSLSNTLLYGNTAAQDGGGLCLQEGTVSLINSEFYANTAIRGGGLYFAQSSGELINTISADNQATWGSGFFAEHDSHLHVKHATLAENHGGAGIQLGSGTASTLHLTNTILVSHTTGIVAQSPNRAHMTATLWFGNGANASSDVLTDTDVLGDPAFEDPANHNYHILTHSAARDEGVETGVAYDIDGDSRPIPAGGKPDIGADEFAAGFELYKEVYPTTVQAGEQLTYTIYVTNTGGVTLTNTLITDTLPPQVTAAPEQALTWTRTISVGEAFSETFVVTANYNYSGTLINKLNAYNATYNVQEETDCTSTVLVNPSITITKRADPAEVQAGAVLTYHITVTNTGNVDVNVSITETVPDNTQHYSETPEIYFSPVITLGNPVWQDTFTVTVDYDYTGTLTNTLSATAVPTDAGYQVIPVTEWYTETSLAAVTPAVTVTKSVTPEYTLPGQTVTYTIIVTNIGNSTLHDIIITDTLEPPLVHFANGSQIFRWTPEAPLPPMPGVNVWSSSFRVVVGGSGIFENHVDVTTRESAIATTTASIVVNNPAYPCQAKVQGQTITYTLLQHAIAAAPIGGTVLVSGECTDNKDYGDTSRKEVGYITKTLTIQGGYSPAWVWNPQLYPTTINANRAGRVFEIKGTSTINVVLDSMHIISGSSGTVGGGGIRVQNANLTISNCVIANSVTQNNAPGGGILHSAGTNLTIINSIVKNNTATGNADGGGIYINNSSARLTLNNTTIEDNTARTGGGIYLKDAILVLTNTRILNNSANNNGGGVYLEGIGTTSKLDNNIFVGNTANKGGGIYLKNGSSVAIRHNTFSDNSVSGGGREGAAIRVDGGSNNTVINSIFANHSGAAAVFRNTRITLNYTLWYSNSGKTNDDLGNNNPVPGDPDPQFTSDYHIQATSPARDAGIATTLHYDIDSHPRPIPTGGKPDIGADEYPTALAISKQAMNTPQAGGLLTYTILYTVSGVAPAPGVIITDAIPEYITYNSGCDAPGCTQNGNLITWTLGTLTPADPPVGAALILELSVASPLTDGLQLINTAGIVDSNGLTTTTAIAAVNVQSGHEFTVTKTAPPTVTAGSELVYTIHYTVTGNQLAHNVVITDTYDTNTGTPACLNCNSHSGYVTWNIGSLDPTGGNYPASGSVTLTVTVDENADGGLTLTNIVTIADTLTDASDDADTIVDGYRLEISKAAPETIKAGQELGYTLTYTVVGNIPAENVIITDTVPTGTTFKACADSEGNACFDHPNEGQIGDVVWILPTLTPNQNTHAFSDAVYLTVTVLSDTSAGANITNTTIIANNEKAPEISNEVTTTVLNHAVAISKQANDDTVAAGELLTYTLFYTITGNELVSGLTITDALPDNTTYQSCSGGTDCAETGGIVTWSLNDASPGQVSSDVTLIVTVNAPLTNGTNLRNTATIFDSEGKSDTSNEVSVEVQSSHEFTITKTGETNAAPNEPILYTIYYTVTGTELAHNVVITDIYDANTGTPDCLGCTPHAGYVTWNICSLDPTGGNYPASGSITLTVTVDENADGGLTLTNVVTIADALTDASDDADTVVDGYRLEISKSASDDVIDVGKLLTYTITYTVVGNIPVNSAIITDAYDTANTEYSSCGNDCTEINPGVIQWEITGSIPNNIPQTVSLTVRVKDDVLDNTKIGNEAIIANAEKAPQTSERITTTVRNYTLDIGKEVNITSVDPEALIEYTLSYTIVGSLPATGVVITDTVPANTTFDSCGGCYDPGTNYTGPVTWSLGSPSAGTQSVTVTVKVDANTLGGVEITNMATIASHEKSPQPSNSVTTTVNGAHGFNLVKTTDQITVAAGDLLTYTITYTVIGNESAEGITITDTLPLSTTYHSCTDCDQHPEVGHTGTVTWTFPGTHAPGANNTVTLTVRADASVPTDTSIANTAYIFDGNGGTPNQDTASNVTAHNCWIHLNGTAYATLQAAVSAATEGDTIQLAGACYQNSLGGSWPLNLGAITVTLEGGYAPGNWDTPNPNAPAVLDANGNGQVIAISGGAVITLANLEITGGNVTGNGGGISISGSSLVITNTHISNNTANGDNDGGGIYATNSLLAITNSRLEGNTSGDEGGAVYLENSKLLLVNSQVLRNNALSPVTADGGGGIFIQNSSILTTVNSVFAENAAGDVGGAIHVAETSKLHSVHSTLASNTADNGGAGIFVRATAQAYITNTIVATHTEAISAATGSIVHIANTLWHNTPTTVTGDATITGYDEENDPLFSNPGADDYRLGAGSPAIGKGQAVNLTLFPAAARDFEGDLRHPTTPDLGADERTAYSGGGFFHTPTGPRYVQSPEALRTLVWDFLRQRLGRSQPPQTRQR